MMARTAKLSVLSEVIVDGWPSNWAADSTIPWLDERSMDGRICHPCAPIPSFTVPSPKEYRWAPLRRLVARVDDVASVIERTEGPITITSSGRVLRNDVKVSGVCARGGTCFGVG